MTVPPKLLQTVLDAPDVHALAEFYRQLLGWRYRHGAPAPDADWITLSAPDGTAALAFQQVESLTATTWPDPAVPQQLHLDLTVASAEELVAARDRAVALGARLLLDRFDDPDEPLYVLADLAGHPFCLFVAG